MAYIGQGIKQGTFKVLDTSGNTYNGSNTTFNLGTQVGSEAQLLVSHDGLKLLQDKWDENNKSYKKNREKEYPKVSEQLDKLYHDMTAGKLDATGEWHKAIKAIKDKYPKE